MCYTEDRLLQWMSVWTGLQILSNLKWGIPGSFVFPQSMVVIYGSGTSIHLTLVLAISIAQGKVVQVSFSHTIVGATSL